MKGSRQLAAKLRPGDCGWLRRGPREYEAIVTSVYRTNVAVCYTALDGRDVICVVPVVDTTYGKGDGCFSQNRNVIDW